MSLLVQNKAALVAMFAAGVLTVTGCAPKSQRSQVAVSPLGMNGYNGGNGAGANGAGDYYDGSSLVNNSSDVVSAASKLQSIVYFGYDSSSITNQSAGILNSHASLLNQYNGSRVLVVGHTDPRGSREYNMALGERRAQAVRNYLESKGVNPANVEITSRGEEEASGNYTQDRKAVLSY